MSDFKKFSDAVRTRFDLLSKGELYKINSDKDSLWDIYLESFPDGTNEIYKERTEHDCNCCKTFIRRVGNVVAIVDGELQSVWDVDAEYPYNIVAEKMNEFVLSSEIRTTFLYDEMKISSATTIQLLDDGKTINWNHFSCVLPSSFVVHNVAEKQSSIESAVSVFKRGLDELTQGALDIVVDLIDQNSIYRGSEFKSAVVDFQNLKTKYTDLNDDQKNIFIWSNHKNKNIRFRNTVIGTLVQDISDGVDLDKAVKSFEGKVAPTNYKRTTSLITKNMVDDAMKTIKELDLEDSLKRRFAVVEDISVNNVMFVNRDTSVLMKDSLESLLLGETKDTKTYDKVDEITIEDFVENVLPKTESMSIMLKNKHISNLVSLISPQNDDDKKLFKWDNKFSWSYKGDITDSIKEKVKRAGGNVSGKLRVSLGWFNYDDLDIHCSTPSGRHISYSNKCGILDVDMNAGGSKSREAVENLIWQNLEVGTYKIHVHNFHKRESVDFGFVIETEYENNIQTFSYDGALGSGSKKHVIDLYYDGKDVTISKIYSDIKSESLSQDIWNVSTNNFQKVNAMMLSPNYWDDQNGVGNKHYFFMLDKCVNPDKVRGIYNEFLINDLTKHRKVFEVLGSKTKCEHTNNQLSGVGFSSTKQDGIIVKVEGSFNRTLKIKF